MTPLWWSHPRVLKTDPHLQSSCVSPKNFDSILSAEISPVSWQASVFLSALTSRFTRHRTCFPELTSALGGHSVKNTKKKNTGTDSVTRSSNSSGGEQSSCRIFKSLTWQVLEGARQYYTATTSLFVALMTVLAPKYEPWLLKDESSMVNTEGFFFLFPFFFSRHRLSFSPVWFGPFVLPVLFPGERFLLKASSHMCRRIRNRLHYAAAHCKCKESEIVSPCGSSVIRFGRARSLHHVRVQWIVEKQQVRSAGHGGGN